jgi:hypothetical protein
MRVKTTRIISLFITLLLALYISAFPSAHAQTAAVTIGIDAMQVNPGDSVLKTAAKTVQA